MSSAANAIGVPFLQLLQVDSTNNYAMALARAGMAQHGTAVFSRLQTGGKGQRGRQWLSESGQNVILSVILEPEGLPPENGFLLSQAIALGVYRFFNKYAGEDTRIKWPNDLYWRDRKAGGILIENSIRESRWNWAIAGMGININQTGFEGMGGRPVSLRQITGQSHDPLSLAQELCHYLEEAWQQLRLQPASLQEAYHSILYKRGELVRLRCGEREFEAIVQGVSPKGRLLVSGASEESFAVGEVEWIGEVKSQK